MKRPLEALIITIDETEINVNLDEEDNLKSHAMVLFGRISPKSTSTAANEQNLDKLRFIGAHC